MFLHRTVCKFFHLGILLCTSKLPPLCCLAVK
jgi:hypothetical protein